MITKLLVSLIPTAVTIIVAYGTRKVWLALLLGVFSGALAFNGIGTDAAAGFGNYLAGAFADTERLKITFFVMMVSGMLAVISETGANLKFGQSVGGALPNGRAARFTAVGLSSLLFFDDYANVLIAGASMRPVTDRHGVSPAKLAYFIDVLAALASLMLVSTWAAFEVSLIGGALKNAGMELNPVKTFISAIPFHIFTYFNIFLVFLVAYNGRWFAGRRERAALKVVQKSDPGKSARRRDMVVPILTLLTVSMAGILISGRIAAGASGKYSIMDILGNASTIDALNWGVISGAAVMIFMILKDNVLGPARLAEVFFKGVRAMIPTGAVIILAKGLEFCARDLKTGYHLAGLFQNTLPPSYIPALIFVIAAAVTVASGFSWSSMALIMPIAVQMTSPEPGLVTRAAAATISGAICGAQLIPYSDKTVMSAAACGIEPLYHTRTQSRQIGAAAALAFFGYLLLGAGLPVYAVLAGGFIMLAAAHFLFSR